jgi:hypothetical protein
MHFTRTVSVKHHPTGNHYVLSIPRPVAEALNLHEEGGLVSIEIVEKSNTHKKGVRAQAVLKAYRDSDFAWREKFDPTYPKGVRPVAILPRTIGPSKPWGCGKVLDIEEELKDLRATTKWLRMTFPRRRGRKRKRR